MLTHPELKRTYTRLVSIIGNELLALQNRLLHGNNKEVDDENDDEDEEEDATIYKPSSSTIFEKDDDKPAEEEENEDDKEEEAYTQGEEDESECEDKGPDDKDDDEDDEHHKAIIEIDAHDGGEPSKEEFQQHELGENQQDGSYVEVRRSKRIITPSWVVKSPWIDATRKSKGKRKVDEKDSLFQLCTTRCSDKEGDEEFVAMHDDFLTRRELQCLRPRAWINDRFKACIRGLDPIRSRSAFGLPTSASSFGSLQPPVIPDSLTTLSQYVSHLRHEFEAIVREGGNSTQAAEAHRNEASISSSPSGSTPEGLLSPSYLAEVLHSTRRMFVEQANECLFQLATQLENQANVTDPLLRSNTQSRAWRTGVLFYNLGACLLELGRTTMALRLGQTPSEAVANGGPAVFISSSGPNHIMVQPFPFQPGASFGSAPVGTVQPPSGLGSGLGSSFYPRRIDIQIRRGTSTSSANVNREEHGDTQSASVQRNPVEISVNQASSRLPEDLSFGGESGVRIVPIRTMVAAVPSHLGRNPSESSANSIGLYYPVIGRFQHAPSGHGNSESGSQPASQHHASAFHAAQQSSPESTGQRQSMDDPARNGSSSTPGLRQEPSNTRRVNINVLTAGGLQSNQESERQIPNNVLQFIRALFPGGEIHVEDPSPQGTTGAPTSDHAGTSTGAAHVPESEPRASEEGIFLSNLLRGVMPLISQAGSGTDGTPQGENASDNQTASDSSSQGGTSRRQSDSDPSPPNSKRQKTE